MNWEAIGAAGEVAGAVGVLITLFYLAYQIRQNSVLLQQSIQQNAAQNTQNQFLLFQDPFTREAVLKSFHTDEEISIEQASAAEAFLMGAMAPLQSRFYNYRSGLVSKQDWEMTRTTIAFYFTTSWPRAWWEMAGETYDPEFSALVSEIINDTAISGTHLAPVLERSAEIRREHAQTAEQVSIEP